MRSMRCPMTFSFFFFFFFLEFEEELLRWWLFIWDLRAASRTVGESVFGLRAEFLELDFDEDEEVAVVILSSLSFSSFSIFIALCVFRSNNDTEVPIKICASKARQDVH